MVCLFPLFFASPVEDLIKLSLALLQVATLHLAFRWVFKLPTAAIFTASNKLFALCSVLLELYKAFCHQVGCAGRSQVTIGIQALFGARADFLPSMLTSLVCAVSVHWVFLSLLFRLSGLKLRLAKARCLRAELAIKRSAGAGPKPHCGAVAELGTVDISAHPRISALGVLSYTVFDCASAAASAHEPVT